MGLVPGTDKTKLLASLGAASLLAGAGIAVETAIDLKSAVFGPPGPPHAEALRSLREDGKHFAAAAALAVVSFGAGAFSLRRDLMKLYGGLSKLHEALDAIEAYSKSEFQKHLELHKQSVEEAWKLGAGREVYQPDAAGGQAIVERSAESLAKFGLRAVLVSGKRSALEVCTREARARGMIDGGSLAIQNAAAIAIEIHEPEKIRASLELLSGWVVDSTFDFKTEIRSITELIDRALFGNGVSRISPVTFPGFERDLKGIFESLRAMSWERIDPADSRRLRDACSAIENGYFKELTLCRTSGLHLPRPAQGPEDWFELHAQKSSNVREPLWHQVIDDAFADYHNRALAAIDACFAVLKSAPGVQTLLTQSFAKFEEGIRIQKEQLGAFNLSPERRDRLLTIIEESEFRLKQQYGAIAAR